MILPLLIQISSFALLHVEMTRQLRYINLTLIKSCNAILLRFYLVSCVTGMGCCFCTETVYI